MRIPPRSATVLLAGAAALTMALGASTAHAQPAPSLHAQAPPALPGQPPLHGFTDPARTVTLLTGDKVFVENGQPRVIGRPGISYAIERVTGHLYVVPSDATDLLEQGKLDRRLFDVQALLAEGSDDAHAKSVRLIIQSGAASRQANAIRSINAVPTSVPKDQTAAYWNGLTKQRTAGFTKIWLDGKRRISLDKSVPQIGAPEAWQAGFTGKGVKVAVLDTGIDPAHPDLADQVIARQNFTETSDDDEVGHGTHVASTIAGTGKASGGKYKGVAPDAKLLIGKVCEFTQCFDSAILAGMDWAVAQHATVVNLSLGNADTPEIDPLEEAVNRLSATTLFVVAAGNQPGCSSVRYGVTSPATADAALAVGAVTKSDILAGFSCTGPRMGDHAIKPDLTAPGVDIVAARAAGGVIGQPVDDYYTTLSGTSMATPHVVGSAAILAQQHPDWKASELKSALMAASKVNPGQTVFEQGAGRVDIAAATKQTVTTSDPSLSFGTQLWPHTDDQPVTKTITYRNYGTAPVELALSLNEAAVFTIDKPTVTVPAGGTAQVQVTANTRDAGTDGFNEGRLTATSGTTHLTTALAIEKEVESYDLTIKHLDRQGKPVDPVETLVASLDDKGFLDTATSAVSTLRLPKGRYQLNSYLRMPGAGEEPDRAFLAMPEVTVDRPLTVTFDSAKSKPITVRAPEPGAIAGSIILNYGSDTASYGFVTAGDFTGLSSAQFGPAVDPRQFSSSLLTQWCKGTDFQCDTDSPYEYLLHWYVRGKLYTGFDKTVRKQDLAAVKTDFNSTSANQNAEYFFGATSPDGLSRNLDGGFPATLTLPARQTLYFQPSGVRWTGQFREYDLDEETGDLTTRSELGMSPRVFKAGTSTEAQWNRGVLGPAFPPADSRPFDPVARPWAGRTGDHLCADLPLFTDSSDHAGFSATDQARTTLTRDGEVVVDSTGPAGVVEAELPAGEAAYRLAVEAERTSQQGVSSEVDVAWTFTSAHVANQPLPLSTIRFRPTLDSRNRARPGTAWIPVTVERQRGSTAAPVRTLTVEASYDDGKTWQSAPLKQGAAKVVPPAGTRYVSLRATSTDRAGNTVTQTILRAYAIS